MIFLPVHAVLGSLTDLVVIRGGVKIDVTQVVVGQDQSPKVLQPRVLLVGADVELAPGQAVDSEEEITGRKK